MVGYVVEAAIVEESVFVSLLTTTVPRVGSECSLLICARRFSP